MQKAFVENLGFSKELWRTKYANKEHAWWGGGGLGGLGGWFSWLLVEAPKVTLLV